MLGVFSILLAQVLYQRSKCPRVLWTILINLTCTEISDVAPGISQNQIPILGVGPLSAPINTQSTDAFTHPFSSSFSSLYFSSFSCSFFLIMLLLGFATSTTTAFFSCLSATPMSGSLAIWNQEVPQDFSFCNHLKGCGPF